MIINESFPEFKHYKQQNKDRRSRASVLRGCRQRVGSHTKIIPGFRRPVILNRMLCTGLFQKNLNCFVLNRFLWDHFVMHRQNSPKLRFHGKKIKSISVEGF